MGFLKNVKGSQISELFKAIDDISFIGAGAIVELALYDTYVTMHVMMKKQIVRLRYDQITDVYHGPRTEYIQKNKSVIGRAIIGGVLLGPIGAVVGGTSGVGTNKKKDVQKVLIISYIDAHDKEQFVVLQDMMRFKSKKLAVALKKMSGGVGSVMSENVDVHL
jgi:hypothetical protein